MKAFIPSLLIWLWAVPAIGQPPADSATENTTATGVLRAQFINSQSGTAVAPESVLINGRTLSSEAEQSAALSVPLPPGRYELHVEARGFHSLTATATVGGEDTMVQTFELDPLTQQARKEIPDNTGVLEGNVVDAYTAAPLSQVNVSIHEKGLKSETDAAGRYSLAVPLTKGNSARRNSEVMLDGERVTLHIEKNGYTSQEHRNVEVLRAQYRTHTVQLEPSAEDVQTSTPTVTDEVGERRSARGSEWMFDVTFD